MPFYQPPRSDADRLNFVRRAVTTAAQDRASGLAYVSEETASKLADLVAQYQPAYDDLAARLGDRAKEVREREAALSVLEMFVRDFVEVLRRRVRRQSQPAEIFNLYGLPQDGTLPNTTASEEWLTRAAAIVAGEARAVAAGHGAMVNPSAAEVEARLTSARQESDQLAPADRAYDMAQAAVAALRSTANAMIENVVEEVRFATRRMDAPSQRRVLRSYGARFSYLPGEPRDDDDPDEDAPDAPPAP